MALRLLKRRQVKELVMRAVLRSGIAAVEVLVFTMDCHRASKAEDPVQARDGGDLRFAFCKFIAAYGKE